MSDTEQYHSPRPVDEEGPPAVTVEADTRLVDYTRLRLIQHMDDSYCGLLMLKFPEDLRTYEHMLWASRSNVVIELGSQTGGSTLWFRDRLVTMATYGRVADPRVIAVDIDISETEAGVRHVDRGAAHITLVDGDVLDPGLAGRIEAMLRPGDVPFVIEDTAHEHDTTLAALQGFAHLVPLGSWFVVEDTVVDDDELRVNDEWPRGVVPALQEWLATEQGAEFEVDHVAEHYGVTGHPGGFLRRRRLPGADPGPSLRPSA
jgi:cephalosporin hydroxylase